MERQQMRCRHYGRFLNRASARRLRKVTVALGVVVALVPSVSYAEKNLTCQNNLKQIGIAVLHEIEGFDIAVVADVNPAGKLLVRGTAAIQDGTSNTLLFAENRGSTAACADSDGDGVAGLVGLTIGFRFERSGERVVATVRPIGEEVDETGEDSVWLDLGFPVVREVEVRLNVVFDEGKKPLTGRRG